MKYFVQVKFREFHMTPKSVFGRGNWEILKNLEF